MARTLTWTRGAEKLIADGIQKQIKSSAEPLIKDTLRRIEAELRETVAAVAVKLSRSVDIVHMEDRLRIEVRLPETKEKQSG